MGLNNSLRLSILFAQVCLLACLVACRQDSQSSSAKPIATATASPAPAAPPLMVVPSVLQKIEPQLTLNLKVMDIASIEQARNMGEDVDSYIVDGQVVDADDEALELQIQQGKLVACFVSLEEVQSLKNEFVLNSVQVDDTRSLNSYELVFSDAQENILIIGCVKKTPLLLSELQKTFAGLIQLTSPNAGPR